MGEMTATEGRVRLLALIDDLIEQATTERSHFYTASILKLARERIRIDGEVLEHLSNVAKNLVKSIEPFA